MSVLEKHVSGERSKETASDNYLFWCPGCKTLHVYYTVMNDGSIGWEFNGDMEKPTFTPSLLNVRPGSDCSHELSGQIIDMVDLDTL